MSFFRVENLHARPAGSDHGEILTGLDLVVEPGEVHAIMGPNGREKTTLGSTLMRSPECGVSPDQIHILVDGRIVTSGGTELAEQLERDGYEAFRLTAGSAV